MHKLFRSLLAVGALTAFAACGDDVSIQPPPPETVQITGAPTTAIKVGDIVQLSANVPVTWESSNNAVASVDQTGRVTAVAAGVASIKATSQEDATKSASVTITITGTISPTVSIASITAGGVPVNPTNVAGLIQVNVNMDPGDFQVQRVELLVDGQVVDQQNFGSSVQAEAAVAVDGEPADQVQPVQFTLNTAEFNPTTGAATYPNGTHSIGARVVVVGGGSSGAAAPEKQLTFNNQGGLVFTITNDNGTDPASAVNPNTGITWIGGDVTIGVVGVSYIPGQAFSSVTISGFGGLGPTAIPLTNGVGSLTLEEDDELDTYQSGGVEPLIVVASVLGGAAGPTTVLNGTNDIPALPQLMIDNVAPPAPTTGGGMPLWVNASFTFDETSTDVTVNPDAGVGGETASFFYIAGNLPTGCSTTGMTAVSSGSELAETIVATTYRGRAIVKDLLGNTSCVDLAPGGGTTFGADFTPPQNVTFTGVDDGDVFGGATAVADASAVNYVLASTGDNASGISATTPGLVSIHRVGDDDDDDCVVGDDCDQVAAPGTAAINGGSANEGYFTITAQMTDNAGNAAPDDPFMATFLVDATNPTFTGNVGLAAQYSGNAPATFTNLHTTDNLDLSRLFGVVSYTTAGLNIEYPAQTIGSFGLPLEQDFSGDYTIPSLIRCINAAGSFGQDLTAEAQQITFISEDQAGNQGTVAPVAGALSAALDDCGAVGNLTAPSVINSWTDVAPNYGGTKTQVSKSGSTSGSNAASVVLSAVADVTVDNSGEPFSRVEFYYQNAAGNWVFIGQSAGGLLNQGVTTRTWTYSFTWDPDSSVPTNATTNVIAIGIDAQGDAVRTLGVVVNVAD